jgi:hypothetical protein
MMPMRKKGNGYQSHLQGVNTICFRQKTGLIAKRKASWPDTCIHPHLTETFTLPCLFDPQAHHLKSGFAQDAGACS